LRALAYVFGMGNVVDLGHAFAAGCARHGVRCEVRRQEQFEQPEAADVVFMYGLAEPLFSMYGGKALRIVADLGYWRETAHRLSLEHRPVRIALNAQQPDAHLNCIRHSSDRFDALGLDVEPVQTRGEYLLIAGHCPVQAALLGFDYGEWEAWIADMLRYFSLRPLVIREKPGSAPLLIEGTTRCPQRDIGPAIRNAFAVICHGGNVGADAILHGVPVFAMTGPGAVYYRTPLAWVDDVLPLSQGQRTAALADLAYWQWTPAEIAAGDLWAHLCMEGAIA
jgi:hypothetical protein